MAEWFFAFFVLSLLTLPAFNNPRFSAPSIGTEKGNQEPPDRLTADWIEPVFHDKGTAAATSQKIPEKQFDSLILKAAHQYGIDPALVKAVIKAESGYDPKAVSRQGAKGLMQLMPKTAQALGVGDCFNPEYNINGGVKYLKGLLKRYDGDIQLTLAAYNAGMSNVKRYGGVPPFKETIYYIKKVFEYYDTYKQDMFEQVGEV